MKLSDFLTTIIIMITIPVKLRYTNTIVSSIKITFTSVENLILIFQKITRRLILCTV